MSGRLLHRQLQANAQLIMCSLLLLFGGPPAPVLGGEAATRGEYALKAAFIYNFAKFVEWPDGTFAFPDTPFTLCVVGNDPFGPALDAVTAKPMKGRRVQVKQVPASSGASDCQILFVSESALIHITSIVGTLSESPILTVCDTARCAEQGVMINLKTVDEKIRLDVNLKAIRHTRLQVSAQLLKLATVVEPD